MIAEVSITTALAGKPKVVVTDYLFRTTTIPVWERGYEILDLTDIVEHSCSSSAWLYGFQAIPKRYGDSYRDAFTRCFG